jgi:hypothetical protein
MAEFLFDVPVECDDKDCPHHWHRSSYFIIEDGTVCVSEYEDDDLSPIDGMGPLTQEQDEAWLEYHRFVAETGDDPLKEYIIPPPKKTPRRWQARVRNWIGAKKHGLKVTGVRRRGRGKWLELTEVPPCVWDFLIPLRNKRNALGDDMRDFAELAEVTAGQCEVLVKSKLEGYLNFTVVEEAPPWTEKRMAKYLKQEARKSIKERM